MIDNRTVGKTISTLRQDRGMTQQQLAAAMNVSHQAVSKWENGAALPDVQTLVDLSQLFGITLEQLLGGCDSQNMDEEVFEAEETTVEEESEEVEKNGEATAEESSGRIDLQELLKMAPFMSKNTVEELLEKNFTHLTPAQIARFAPFVSEACLERLILNSESELNWDTFRRVAPFMKKEAVDAIARAIAAGEKYVRPAKAEVKDAAEEVFRTLDDVSKKIGEGVDKAMRKVAKFGENVVNEVSKAFDSIAAEVPTREERLAKLRRSAFERAMDDGRWDWIEAHLSEITDEDFRQTIAERAAEAGRQDWINRNFHVYADEATLEKAIAEEDWNWLSEHVWEFEEETQSRIAMTALQSGNWEWLKEYAEGLELYGCVAEIADAARREGEYDLAYKLIACNMRCEQRIEYAAKVICEEDEPLIARLDRTISHFDMPKVCVLLAQAGNWAGVMRLRTYLDADSAEELLSAAIEQGNFDAVDMLDGIIRGE